MCASCVAQGVAYVGGAVGALQVMRARARMRRLGSTDIASTDALATATDAGSDADGAPEPAAR
jgi:hypothetical protein